MFRRVMYAAMLLTLGAGAGFAAPSNVAPIPGTAEYLRRTTPMISGTVTSVEDRQLVIDTGQGDQVTLAVDSRTMLPADLAPGMALHAEFRVMENGQYYATRITPDRDGTTREVTEAVAPLQSNDEDLPSAEGASVDAAPAVSEGSGMAGQSVSAEAAGAAAPAADQTTAGDTPGTETRPDTLPGTAGTQPLVGLFGLIALAGAGVLMLRRRRARV